MFGVEFGCGEVIHKKERTRALHKNVVDTVIDDVVSETLQSNLPPLLEDVPPAFRADLAQLETLSNEALRQQMYATFAGPNAERYDDLLALNTSDGLSENERKELSDLRTQADRLMYRKVYAALLLKWRGERVPTLAEMEAN